MSVYTLGQRQGDVPRRKELKNYAFDSHSTITDVWDHQYPCLLRMKRSNGVIWCECGRNIYNNLKKHLVASWG